MFKGQEPEYEDLMRIIEALKTGYLMQAGISKAPPGFICNTCGWSLAAEEFIYCSAPHPCKDCHYYPYIAGIYIGCMCGIACNTCNNSGMMLDTSKESMSYWTNCIFCTFGERKVQSK